MSPTNLTQYGINTRSAIPAQSLVVSPGVFVVPKGSDCELDALTFCNTDAVAHQVTVLDGNGNAIVSNQNVDPNSTLTLFFRIPGPASPATGQFMQGGIQWFADAGGVMVGHITARYG
jgi:hypothetical protein